MIPYLFEVKIISLRSNPGSDEIIQGLATENLSAPECEILLDSLRSMKKKIDTAERIGKRALAPYISVLSVIKKTADILVKELEGTGEGQEFFEKFPAEVRSREEYLFAFSRGAEIKIPSREKYLLAHLLDEFGIVLSGEFLSGDSQFREHLDEILFHELYGLAEPENGDYEIHKKHYGGLQRLVFGSENPLKELFRSFIDRKALNQMDSERVHFNEQRAYAAHLIRAYLLIPRSRRVKVQALKQKLEKAGPVSQDKYINRLLGYIEKAEHGSDAKKIEDYLRKWYN